MSELKAHGWLWPVVPFFLFSQGFALLFQIWRWRPQLIHAHWLIPQGVVTWLVTRITNVPYVVTVHGGDIHQFNGKGIRGLKRRTLNRAYQVTAVSTQLAEELHQQFTTLRDVSIFPMGVEVERFADGARNEALRENILPRGGLLVLFVGRLVPKKGGAYALEAIKHLVDDGVSVHLVFLGMGSEYGRLQRLAQEYGISGAVTFRGTVDHNALPDWYATADVCLLPALTSEEGDREGWGLSLIEGIAAGCLPLGSKETCLSEIVPSEYASLLMSEVDGQALKNHITDLTERTEEWPRIRSVLQEKVRDAYSWEHISHQYKNILHDAL